jgi:tRNA threonylcarbamoyladenosine biosynthesis protein TsaB
MKLLLPRLLLIDTCGTIGTIALADTSASPSILATITLSGRTASERLIPAIKALLADQATTLQSLSAIAVVHGPGSFTGVRIGLSAAKGLCEALAIPLIAISRLAVLANLARPTTGYIHALLDAGRAEFYYGAYQEGVCLRESLLTHDELLQAIQSSPKNSTLIVCEPSVAESLASLAPQLVSELTATDALPLALHRLHEANFDDIATIDANYVRRTDAEIFAKPKPPAAPAQAPEPRTR